MTSEEARSNARLIERLYSALGRRDGEAMAACYLPGGRFRDPAFGELTGEQAGDMWRLLTGRSGDLAVELAELEVDGDRGKARWIARYTFTPTGRTVTNEGLASFRFHRGLISEHEDRFSFWRWSRQALGPVGALLGWSPLLRLAVRRRARRDLGRFSSRRRLKESAKSDENTSPRS